LENEKIVEGIKIVKNHDFFIKDENCFKRTEQLEEASTHKSAITHVSTVFVPGDLDL